ncbi:MAG: response regulator transcription factor [Flavobacteriaceae bacterium]|nr:response regulator transcription factor [Flavobacteriaceae bacterium]
MIKLAIAEDHQAIIDGILLLLEYEEDISIVGTTNDGEALVDLVRKKQPDVVLTDIRMPKKGGVAATEIIKKEFPNIKVLAFTMFDQNEAVQQMLEAGASGYLLKNSPLEEVLKAIRLVYSGNTFFDANIKVEKKSKGNTRNKGILTKRQNEILKLIAQGKTSLEIADELYIGVLTVDTHRKNMIRILGLKGKGALMRYALDKKYKF